MKNKSTKFNLNNGMTFSSRVGDFVDTSLSNAIAGSKFIAPVLQGMPDIGTWYRVYLNDAISGDGSDYYFYIRQGNSPNLCIFFSGGGVAWNEYTAARPVTGGRKAAGLPNYYWNNLRPLTQLMNINTGITDTLNPANPFKDWSFVIITYATGDLHIGNNDFPYIDENGNESLVHFRGHQNFMSIMKNAVEYFPSPDKLLIAGDSAGAFAVPALADEILTNYYPGTADVTLFSDSGLLLYPHWKRTARDIWKAEPSIYKSIHSNNITLDWYETLYKKYKDSIRYLYASSTHDYLLSAYYNDIVRKTYLTNSDVQEVFFEQLKDMVSGLKVMSPNVGIYLNNWKNLIVIYPGLRGGTVHTAVRHLNFYSKLNVNTSMAQWLYDAVNGNVYDAGRPIDL